MSPGLMIPNSPKITKQPTIQTSVCLYLCYVSMINQIDESLCFPPAMQVGSG